EDVGQGQQRGQEHGVRADGQLHQRALGLRHPHGLALAAVQVLSAPPAAVPAGGLQALAAEVAGVVRPDERRHHDVAAPQPGHVTTAVSRCQAFFFQYSIVGPVCTPAPTTALFRTSAISSGVIVLRFWTARMLSSICPCVPAPQMATCTPGWLSVYLRHSVGLSDLSKNALPKTFIAWMPTPRSIATGRAVL